MTNELKTKDQFSSEIPKFVSRPTRKTIFMRTFLPFQVYRFIVINIKMLKMIAKGHGKGTQ